VHQVSLGLDSFGFVELGGRIQKQFNIDINSVKLTPDQTLVDVASIIFKLQKRTECDASGAEAGAAGGGEQETVTLVSSAARRAIMSSRFDADRDIWPAAALRKKSMSARLLTKPLALLRRAPSAHVLFGATGLMGSHLLRYLIKGGATKVYCIVRAATDEAAYNRIVSCMEDLRIWKPEFAASIVGLAGDLLKEDLGLKPDVFEDLLANVAHIVQAAGSRAWHMDQAGVDVSTRGTINCVALAQKTGAAVHYVSSSWLDLYDAAQTEADRAQLARLPYIGSKRQGEEIMHYAAKSCNVRAACYRVPLLSVNSKGGFLGDLVVFTAIQVMVISGMDPDHKGVFPIQTADAAAKFMVREMTALPTRRAHSKASVYTSLAYAELMPWSAVAAMAEERRPGLIRRSMMHSDYLDTMSAFVPRPVLEESRTGGAALERVLAHLRAKSRRPSELVAVALARRKEKQPASAYLKDYVRRNPDVIKSTKLATIWANSIQTEVEVESETSPKIGTEKVEMTPVNAQ
jgi:hypothetical protein